MKERKSISLFHHIARTVLLLGLSVYIAFLVETDSLQLYIGVRIMPLVKASALVVYALAVIQGFIAYRSYKGSVIECDCCGNPPARSRTKASVLYGVLALPLLLGFLLPDTVLGGSFANKKGMILGAAPSPYAASGYSPPTATAADSADAPVGFSGPSSEGSPAPAPAEEEGTANAAGPAESSESLDGLFQAEDEFERELAELAKRIYVLPVINVKPEIYMEILSSVVTFKEQFIGKEIEIAGFVYREPGLADNQLVIGRIAVQCCTADATPYGVLAEFDGASELKDDTWVKLKGTIGQTEYNGNAIIKIDATESNLIERPDNPYIYPNFDFLNVSVE
ncbi:TIGR03943 family putative permease subunit [Paenibacillus macerans]|uniref:TIGR03943 family putative permease subunit n=1 Tax=Paenibacillus macerans TaxID=44252 RepID=UPI00203F4061|nr:TIGR03943 family protein [Paenibacillus macerans]MCM3701612.1 TIGR03943 family protein [Paenibacillus macerans]